MTETAIIKRNSRIDIRISGSFSFLPCCFGLSGYWPAPGEEADRPATVLVFPIWDDVPISASSTVALKISDVHTGSSLAILDHSIQYPEAGEIGHPITVAVSISAAPAGNTIVVETNAEDAPAKSVRLS